MNAHKKRRVFLKLIFVVIIMASIMTGFESLKQLIKPDVSIWNSHIITIIFSTISATLVSFFIIRKQDNLYDRLHSEKEESEKLRSELEITVKELEEALQNVKTLNGLLPICAVCKKIRDDKGYWKQIEHYISEHTGADFSHCICPDCMEKLYPEYMGKE
ncbi:MAG: hypothetical protein JW874_02640 [Spirochaetales bacterium]|nr:hypothetical protein [Spirochaetales bacterium]